MAGDKKKCRCADLGQVSRYTKNVTIVLPTCDVVSVAGLSSQSKHLESLSRVLRTFSYEVFYGP